jgi:hypothetical protein
VDVPLATWSAGSINPRNTVNYLLPNIDTYIVIGANDTAFIDNDNNGVFSEGDAFVPLVNTGGQLQLSGINTVVPNPNQDISIRFVDANLSAPLDLRGFDALDRITVDLSTARWMNAAGLLGLTTQSPSRASTISASIIGTPVIFSSGIQISRLNTNGGLPASGPVFALRVFEEYVRNTTGSIIRFSQNSLAVNSLAANIIGTGTITSLPLNNSRYLALLPNASKNISGVDIFSGPSIKYILPTI